MPNTKWIRPARRRWIAVPLVALVLSGVVAYVRSAQPDGAESGTALGRSNTAGGMIDGGSDSDADAPGSGRARGQNGPHGRGGHRTASGISAIASSNHQPGGDASVAGHERSAKGRLLWLEGSGHSWETGRLVVASSDGSDARTLVDGNPTAPTWSPDGSWIAFVRSEEGARADQLRSHELYVIKGDGTSLRLVATIQAEPRFSAPRALTWSPDASTIAYVQGFTSISGCRSNLWKVDVAGGARTQLTEGSCDYSPTWSPDSQRLAFIRWALGTSLWSIAADGSAARPLTPLGASPREGVGGWPPRAAWSPDGGLIAYDFGPDVWVVGEDGSNHRPLMVERGVSHHFPAWSPDGSRLGLIRWSETEHVVVVVTRQGETERTLAGHRPVREHTLSWSSNGTALIAQQETEHGIVGTHIHPVDGSPSVPVGAWAVGPEFSPA